MADDVVTTAGQVVDHVNVTIGPRFLDLFSAQLYTSPNKAFEELVANSWDAGARVVHVHVPAPPELDADGAAVWVLDNGESMDVDGLKGLWAVAQSGKQLVSPSNHRRQIGKFGIGKLSTYLLADELTYVCRAPDGETRVLTMDYGRINSSAEPGSLDASGIRLDLRVVGPDELGELLTSLDSGGYLAKLIASGLEVPAAADRHDEFHAPPEENEQFPSEATWTLAVMRSLKPAGKQMKSGVIQRILRSALPLGDSLRIVFNEQLLTSTKIDTPLEASWVLGKDELGITAVEWTEGAGDDARKETRTVTALAEPYPHLVVDGIGQVTGEVRLFKDSVAGGKSAEVDASHGFRVNVLGRVVNESEPSFGLPPLSGTAWARTRVAVRVDGLNSELSVSREGLRTGEQLSTMQALLRALFNMARSHWDANRHADFPGAGEIITKKWGIVPLDPLRDTVRDGLTGLASPPTFLQLDDGADRDAIGQAFEAAIASAPQSVIEDVGFSKLGRDAPLTLFDPAERRVVINSDHPFAQEHSASHEQQEVVRDAALADLLTDAYMLTLGVDPAIVDDVRIYRDESLRLIAMVNRRTGPQLAGLLESVTDDDKALEKILDESLSYLGFVVDPKGQSGEPEGIATAPATRGQRGTVESYTFTYDAKSSKTGKVKTHNVGMAGLKRHRGKYDADYTLVVAPDYEDGALQMEAADNGVAPMRARDLARLLVVTASSGPLTTDELREILQLHDPDAIAAKVTELEERVKSRPRPSLEAFLDAVQSIGFSEPDTLTTSVIARTMRERTGTSVPTEGDVAQLIRGLQVMCPNIIRLVAGKGQVILAASPTKLREEILRQLASLPSDLRESAAEALEIERSTDD